MRSHEIELQATTDSIMDYLTYYEQKVDYLREIGQMPIKVWTEAIRALSRAKATVNVLGTFNKYDAP